MTSQHGLESPTSCMRLELRLASAFVLYMLAASVYAVPTLAQTNDITATWTFPIRDVVHVAISSDGRTIAAGSAETGLYLFNESGAQPFWPSYSPPTGQGMKSVAISSDGQYVVAGQDDEGGGQPAGLLV